MKIQVIIGTTRPNRFSEVPANWIIEEFKKFEEVEAELVDLRDYDLPFFDAEKSPMMTKGEYKNTEVARWAKKVGESDGYIIVTAEYNHGYPAVLKNALDWVYYEWNKKPVGFVSYGSAGGARVIEQLRQVAIELDMVPIKNSINIPWSVIMSVRQKEAEDNPFEVVAHQKEGFFSNLIWWTKILKDAKEKENK